MNAADLRAAAVRVPCSTSNLGAGFDCIGLALQRWLEVRYMPDDEPLRIEHAGTLCSVAVDVEHNLLARALRAGLAARGVRTATGRIVATSDVPVSRGLGSSGAATVAGLTLAAAATGQAIDRTAELERALALEGHPDNAAPQLFGGLVAVARSSDGTPHALALPLSDALSFAFAAPDVEVTTMRARSALPATVPHDVATRALGRLAALLRGLETGEPELLRLGFEDELHVPYRLPLIPRAHQAIDAARDAGAIAVTISGSGSGLIAVTTSRAAAAVAQAMGSAFGDGVAFAIDADRNGVELVEQR